MYGASCLIKLNQGVSINHAIDDSAIVAAQQIQQQKVALFSYLKITPKIVEINLAEIWHRDIRFDSTTDTEST